MPGCGKSADPPEHFLRTRDYADCLAAFIEALGLEKPHVLGLSFGSGLALELKVRTDTQNLLYPMGDHPTDPCED